MEEATCGYPWDQMLEHSGYFPKLFRIALCKLQLGDYSKKLLVRHNKVAK